jgi:pantothenate synthetase
LERELAPRIRQALALGPKRALTAMKKIPGAKVDYVALVDAATFRAPSAKTRKKRLLAAVRLGTTRLIDNIDVKA